MRVVLLQTDQVLERFQPEHGDYPAMFSAVLDAPDVDVEVVDVRERIPAPCSAEGYVITGSRHSVYDDLPWIAPLADFLRIEIDAGKKVVGICFGHQLLAHFFGGEVGPARVGWEVGVKETEICAPQPWMKPAASTVNLISSHKDQVLRLPEGAVITARSPDCRVAGFALGDNVITFQGHPEFRKGYSQALMSHRRELLGEEKYAEGVRSLERPTDEDLVGRWILGFLRSGKKSGQAGPS